MSFTSPDVVSAIAEACEIYGLGTFDDYEDQGEILPALTERVCNALRQRQKLLAAASTALRN